MLIPTMTQMLTVIAVALLGTALLTGLLGTLLGTGRSTTTARRPLPRVTSIPAERLTVPSQRTPAEHVTTR
jgi:hypothetical protein